MVIRLLLLLMLFWCEVGLAADVTDATGRTIAIPDHPLRVLPAGPPAAILLAAIAPDLMLGWPSPLSDDARALLAPSTAKLPQIPRLTGREDVGEKIKALNPDLILDYGTVSPRYADLAQTIQQRTGVPAILLDGSMAEIPRVFRIVGSILHREGRAEILATFTEALLILPATRDAHPRVLYARGADGLSVAGRVTDVTEVFIRLGWQTVAPDGQAMFRQTSINAIRTLDPDLMLFSEPAMRDTVMHDDAWRPVRAVREGHVLIAPGLPFGWIKEPPSINRLLGFAWLGGRDPLTLAALFNATVYHHALTPAQLDTVLAGARSLQP